MEIQAAAFEETLNKSVRDLSEAVTGKRGFPVTPKINRLARLILAVPPCTAGISELVRDSLRLPRNCCLALRCIHSNGLRPGLDWRTSPHP